jgi:hypothetical protein
MDIASHHPLIYFFSLSLCHIMAYLQEHLEDKHLRQILLDAETSAFYAMPEANPPTGQGTTK